MIMNKNVIEIYKKVLAEVLDEYELDEAAMFSSNAEECVQARQALIIGLSRIGLSDKEIAECTHKMRRCSVCIIRNKYNDGAAPWTVKLCLEKIKQIPVAK